MSTCPANQANSTKQSIPPDQIGKDGVLTKPSPRISPSSPASRARRARSSTTSRDEPNGETPTCNLAEDAVMGDSIPARGPSGSTVPFSYLEGSPLGSDLLAAAARPGWALRQEPRQRLGHRADQRGV